MKTFLCLAICLLTVLHAKAQNGLGIVRGEVARRDATAQVQTPTYPIVSEPTLGTADEIFLLQESQPLFVRSSTQPVYTSNAFQDFTEMDDWYFQQSLAAGLETLIAERYYFLTELGVATARYDEYSLLDRDTTALLISGSAALTTYTSVGVTWNSSWYFQPDFGDNDFTFHTATIHANTVVPLEGGSSLSIGPVVSRSWSAPDHYNQTAVGLGVSLNVPLGARTEVGFRGRVDYQFYDDYFSDVFSGDREDLSISTGVHLLHRLRSNVEIVADVAFTDNNSTLSAINLNDRSDVGIYDYSAWNVLPTLRLVVHF